ncbi:MAG: polysaccharide deacetylase family protein [Planctomycetaceae bacterium]|nr:polysaccharide deacetylase family protein [Planctomycetaceae bacterium]MBT4725318.1 polysaccharide deacetylase family protein [Planctomycetaceae bacterium]MBT5123273.1 polysaccharide deacetylase family protein [Planctomycetaceae bacterium]MBT5883418.1 polysaccharide deacetylase family protein [Planctomycetaceae bacterium]MBT6847003.1 polysaccharide deacetylase family protein [Planctomycetaceae bacterium]
MKNRSSLNRRQVIAAATAFTAHSAISGVRAEQLLDSQIREKAQVAITFDLEMSRHYPKRGQTEWDYQKGNLDAATKQYSLEAGDIAAKRGISIHFFAVGRVLEQANIDWLKTLSKQGHAIGNHTYDHINVLAATAEQTQFRFQRAPWLVEGKSVHDVIRENIKMTQVALRKRAGIKQNGFRTPGGFYKALDEREDLQKLMLELGFQWISCKYPSHKSERTDTGVSTEVYADIVRAQQYAQPYRYPSGLIEIPMSPISDVTAFRSRFWKLPEFLKSIEMSVSWTIKEQAVFDFLCHPSCLVVEDPKHEALKLICDLVESASNRAEIVSLDKIAATVADKDS